MRLYAQNREWDFKIKTLKMEILIHGTGIKYKSDNLNQKK